MKDATQSSVCVQRHQEADVAINLCMALEEVKEKRFCHQRTTEAFFMTDI